LAKYHTQYEQLSNKSQFHEALRTVLCTELPFAKLTCYQEVNVCDLFPEYEYTNHHYDWYIKELMLIIELHGNQHYKATSFGTISIREKLINYNLLKFRDTAKKGIALQNGFNYLEIPYKLKESLSANLLLELINESIST
jgi:hypothetical protein